MTTIINNPDRGEGNGTSNVSLIVVVLVLLVAGFLIYMYGLPGRGDTEGTNINVPDMVDVNVNPSNGDGAAQ